MVGHFSPKTQFNGYLAQSGALELYTTHSHTHPCFQEDSSQLWETKAVGRGTLNKSASVGLEGDHTGLKDLERES